MERTEVKVDRLPNKTWNLDDLLRIGMQNNVDFGLNSNEEGFLKRNLTEELAVEKLYEQIDFVELQDPVAEIRNRRSTKEAFMDKISDKHWVAKVIYQGNMFASFIIGDKMQVFMPGVEYFFEKDHSKVIEELMKDPNFIVEWVIKKVDGFDPIIKELNRDQIEQDPDRHMNLVFLDSRREF